MKTRSPVLFATAAFAVLALALSAPAVAKEKPVLNRGTPGETIIELVGRPDEITKIKSDEFKAETWIYRRRLEHTVYQTANQQAFIPAMVGFDSGGMIMGKALVPDYKLKYAAAYQVTALLMINDQLHLARQWVAKTEDYAN